MDAVHVKVTRSSVAVAMTIMLVAGSMAPSALALAGPVAPLAAATAPSPVVDPTFAADYAYQLAILQNPVLDAGFEIGSSSPVWALDGGASIEGGQLMLSANGDATQIFGVTSGEGALSALGLGLSASPLNNVEHLSFVADGEVAVTLRLVESATGRVFGGEPVISIDGLNHIDVASFLDVRSGIVFYADGTSSTLAPDEILAASSPLSLSFTSLVGGLGGLPVRVDDVVLDGVEYGTPQAHVELDGPAVSDSVDGMLPPFLTDESNRFAHDGYALAIIPVSFESDHADDLTQYFDHGEWTFAVVGVQFAPSGARALTPNATDLARYTLTGGHANTVIAKGITQIEGQPAALFEMQLDLHELSSLIARWGAPHLDGGLYVTTGATPAFPSHAAGHLNVPKAVAPFALAADALDLRQEEPRAILAILDSDADGALDVDEVALGTDPRDDASTPEDSPLKNTDLTDGHAVVITPLAANGNVVLGVDGSYSFRVEVYKADGATAAPVALDEDRAVWFRIYSARSLPAPLGAPLFGEYYAKTYRIGDVMDESGTSLTIRVPTTAISPDAFVTPVAVAAFVDVAPGDGQPGGIDPLSGRLDPSQGAILHEPANGYFSATKNALRATAAADAMDYAWTPVQLLARTDLTDGYATIIDVEGVQGMSPTSISGTPIAIPVDIDGVASYVFRVRVNEYPDVATDAGLHVRGTSSAVDPVGKSYALALLDLDSAQSLAAAALEGEAVGPWKPCAEALLCLTGTATSDMVVDGTIELAIPALDVLGAIAHQEAYDEEAGERYRSFYALAHPSSLAAWAYVNVPDAVTSVDSASGYYSAAKNAVEALPIADQLDYAVTPIAFATDAEDLDGDGSPNDAELEAGFMAPFDPEITAGDLDGDGLPNSYDPDPNDWGYLDATLVSPVGGEKWSRTHDVVFILDNHYGPRADITTLWNVAVSTNNGAAWTPLCSGGLTNNEDDGPRTFTCPFDSTLFVNTVNARVRLETQIVHGPAQTELSGRFTIDNKLPVTTLAVPTEWQVAPLTLTPSIAPDGFTSAASHMRLDPATADPCVAAAGDFPALASIEVAEEGQWCLSYYALDEAGNRESTKAARVRLDLTDPTTGRSSVPASAESSGWFRTAPLVTLAPADATSLVASTEYAIDGAWSPYTAPFTIPEGVALVEYRSTDNAGRTQQTQSATYKVDTVAPVTTATLSPAAPQANGWYTTAPKLTLAASDATSGLARIEYCVGALPCTWTTYSAPVTLPAGSDVDVRFRAVDVAGHVEEAQLIADLKIDALPPTVSHSVSPAENAAGWRSAPTSVTFTVADDVSGGVQVYCSTGGPATDCTSGLAIGETAGTIVAYHGVDAAGNPTASASTGTIRVDITPPTGSIGIDGPAGTGWHTTAPLVTITQGPSTSPITTKYRVVTNGVNGSWTTYAAPFRVNQQAGNVRVEFYLTDAAGHEDGNQSVPKSSAAIKTDFAPPVTTISSNGPEDGWNTNAAPNVTLSAPDAVSGLDKITVTIDGGEPQIGDTHALPEGTAVNVTYFATDLAGNTEVARSKIYKVDHTPPTASGAISPAAPASGWYKTPPTVTLTANDAVSGLGVVKYRVVNTTSTLVGWTTYTAPFALDVNDAEARVEFYAVDVAGNSNGNAQAPLALPAVKIDQVVPASSFSIDPDAPDGDSAWYRTTPLVTLAAVDPLSGVASRHYCVVTAAQACTTSASFTPFTAPFALPDGVDVSFRYYAVDVAGNAETIKTSPAFDIDTGGISIVAMSPAGTVTDSAPTIEIKLAGGPSLLSPHKPTLVVAGQTIAPEHVAWNEDTLTYKPAHWTRLLRNGPIATSITAATGAGNNVTLAGPSFVVNAADSDKDGVLNTKEDTDGSDKYDPYSTPGDRDGDGIPEVVESVVDADWNAFIESPVGGTPWAPARVPDAASFKLLSVKDVRVRPNANLLVPYEDDREAVRVTYTESNSTYCVTTNEVTLDRSKVLVPLPLPSQVPPRAGHASHRCEVSLAVDDDGDGFPAFAENAADTSDSNAQDNPVTKAIEEAEDAIALVGGGAQNNEFADKHALFIEVVNGEPLTGTTMLATAPHDGFFEFRFEVRRHAMPTWHGERVNVTPTTVLRIALLDEAALKVLAGSPADFPVAEAAFWEHTGTLNDGVFSLGVDGKVYAKVPTGVATAQARTVAVYASAWVEDGYTNPLTGIHYRPVGGYHNVAKNAIRDISPGAALDAMDYEFTPVVLRGYFTELEDGYAMAIEPLGATSGSLAIVHPSAGSYRFTFQALDSKGEAVAPRAGAAVQFALLDVESAYRFGTIMAEGSDWLPAYNAQWSIRCSYGATCEGLAYDAATKTFTVDVPSNEVAAGPFAAWAYIQLDEVLPGVYSAAGYYDPIKNVLAGMGRPAADRLEYAITPIVLAPDVAEGSKDPFDWDGDAPTCSNPFECDNNGELTLNSDPFDPASVPDSDDDRDGIDNRAETIPSWILATPAGHYPIIANTPIG